MDEKKKVVVLKEPDEKSQKREMLWTFLLPILGGVLTILIVLAVSLLPNAMKYSGYSDEDNIEDPFVVPDSTVKAYSNLLSYINIERESLGKEKVTEITSFKFNKENRDLEMVFYLEGHPDYMTFHMPSFSNVDDVLVYFVNNTPSLGTYATSFYGEVYNEEVEVYIHDQRIKTKTSMFSGSTRYVSLLYELDKKTIVGYCHSEYINSGYLDEKELIEVTHFTEPRLYEMYYYILHDPVIKI